MVPHRGCLYSAMWAGSRIWCRGNMDLCGCRFCMGLRYIFPIKFSRIVFVAFSLWWKQSSSLFWIFKKDRSKKYSKTKKLKIYFREQNFRKIFRKFSENLENFQWKINENRKSRKFWKSKNRIFEILNFRIFGFRKFQLKSNFFDFRFFDFSDFEKFCSRKIYF